MNGGRGRRWLIDVGLLLGVFAVGTGVAELAGAYNLGTALAFGQIAFAAGLTAILILR